MDFKTDKLMTRQQVCEALRICIGTFSKMINEEGLPVIQIGRRIFVKKSDLENWIDSKCVVKSIVSTNIDRVSTNIDREGR